MQLYGTPEHPVSQGWEAFLLRLAGYLLAMGLANQTGDPLLQMLASLAVLAALLFSAGKDFSALGLWRMSQWKQTSLLLLLASSNLWQACLPQVTAATIYGLVTMLAVGFVEEMLFRGYLLRLLCRKSTAMGILLSTLTFALLHAGASPADIALCAGFGFALSVFALKTGCLLPCCLFHSIFNALSLFSPAASPAREIATAILAALYGLFLLKNGRHI